MKSIESRGHGISGYGVFLIVFFAAFGFFFIVPPKTYDDYLFLWHIWPWFERQGVMLPEWGGDVWNYGMPWDMISETWKNCYLTDNVRLPNLVAPLLLLFPRWVGGVVVTLLFVLMIVPAFRLAGVNPWRSRLVPVAVVLWTWFLPWHDYFTSIDFCLNYFMPAALALWLLDFLLRDGARNGVMPAVLSSALGLLVGWSHEEVGLSVCAALLVMICVYNDWRRPAVICTCVGMIASVAVIMSVPGMRFRVEDDMFIRTSFAERLCVYWQTEVFNYSLMLLLAVVAAMRFRLRQALANPLLVFVLVSATVNVLPMLIIGYRGRVVFYADFVSVMGVMMLLRINFRGENISRPGIRTINLILMIAALYRLVVIDCYAVILRRETLPALEEYSHHPEQCLFADVPRPDRLPVWMLVPVDPYVRESFDFYLLFRQGAQKDTAGAIRTPFPKALEYATPETGAAMPGDPRIRTVDGHLFMTEEDAGMTGQRCARLVVELDYDGGISREHAEAFRFRSKADGRYYVWLNPSYKGWFVTHFRPIVSARYLRTIPEP